MKTHTAIACLALFLCSATAQAVVTFDWATVGNPGNAPDQLSRFFNPDNLQFGAVDYVYRISKHEVTNDQYTEFLNAVDPMGTNPNSVYSVSMGSDARGGIAFSAGAASGSKYSTKTNMGNKPVNYVSFLDSMRFVNWLENGQPTDGSGTESAVYTIGTGLNETRVLGATFFIPSEDEWYKAAYHQPASQGGDVDDYWRYPTASNHRPGVATANAVGDISNPSAYVANHLFGAHWNGLNDGNVTTVGSGGPLSDSFYGTFDQGGNVHEWNESVIVSSSRGWRGCAWNDHYHSLAASNRHGTFPANESNNLGFRVASISEPSSGCGGDLYRDGTTDGVDVAIIYSKWGTNDALADITNDGNVDGADLAEVFNCWGQADRAPTSVPEPAGCGWLGLWLASLLAARRQTKCATV